MATVEEILARAENEANAALGRAKEALDAGRPSDAKKAITAGQSALRLAKSELVAQEREVRAEFQQARLDMNKAGQTVGMFAGSKARGHMARARAAGKRSLAQRQQDALEPFRVGKAAIDRAVAELGTMKLEIDTDPDGAQAAVSAAAEHTQAAPPLPSTLAAPPLAPTPAAPPPPPTPAVWAPDPFGRHDLRWWDGERWTEHVADPDRGRSIDPPT
jgi:hypothetical protein